MESTPNLGLSVECSKPSIQTKLDKDAGAGVNASSSLNVALVPSDPLSELVWSAQKGLTLKSADRSFPDKKLSLVWKVGKSHRDNPAAQIITTRESNDEKQIDEINLIISNAMESDVEEKVNLYTSCTGSEDINLVSALRYKHYAGNSDNMDLSNSHVGEKENYTGKDDGNYIANDIQMADVEILDDTTDQENPKNVDFLKLKTSDHTSGFEEREAMAGDINRVAMTDADGRMEDVASGKLELCLEVAPASGDHAVKQNEALDNRVQRSTSAGGRPNQLALIVKRESEHEMKTHDSIDSSPPEKLDSTAESNQLFPTSRDDYGRSEERVPRENSVSLDATPLNSRINLCRRKGKEKALSNGDANQILSKGEDDSDESVESCNSVRLFPTGKRPWTFEQQDFVMSKRVKTKTQIEESPGSTSFVRQDSSFMNWISNMVKGLPKSTRDEAPPHGLALANPSHGHQSLNQEILASSKNTEPRSGNMGFQSLFQSLYCPNTKVQSKMSNANYPIGGYKDPVLDEKCNANNKFHNLFLLCGNGDGLATTASAQESCKAKLAENKTSCDLPLLPYVEAKDGVKSPSDSSSSKCKTNSVDDPPAKEKAVHNIGFGGDLLKSSWITRFSAKPLRAVSDLAHHDQTSRRALEGSADCTMPTTHATGCVDFPIDQKGSEDNDPELVIGKELQDAPNTSTAFKRIHGFEDQQSTFKLKPLLPSPKIKSSEVMASVFARRLGAFKHIIPSDVKDDAMNTVSVCFYCGRSGHELRDCTEITQTELEDLLRNITSYEGAEESSCVCIRCFQLDHWAASCPMASSSRQNSPGTSLVNRHTVSKVQHPQLTGAQVIWFGIKPQVDTDLSLNPKCSGKMAAESRISNLKDIASSSRENWLKAYQISPLLSFDNEQTSDVPEGMFDAIKRLRLSRGVILKLMKSQVSLDLDGFFLRLRLGNWEENLGGTGYYVACITGGLGEKPSPDSKNSVPVNVGGIHCSVESRYISNQDFLEDELMAWYCTTARSGGKIPSEEEFMSKFEQRKRLGF